MLTYPQIDPVAISLGPVKVHWYGLAYLAGLAFAWWFAVRRTRRPWSAVRREQVDDLIFYAALGVVLGGRFGYALFYGGDKLAQDPTWLLRVWQGGMSFHGGFLGVLLAMFLFARRQHIVFGALMDFVAPLVPLGLGVVPVRPGGCAAVYYYAVVFIPGATHLGGCRSILPRLRLPAFCR